LKLVETNAAIVSDLLQATEALCQRNARIIIISADNLTTTVPYWALRRSATEPGDSSTARRPPSAIISVGQANRPPPPKSLRERQLAVRENRCAADSGAD
jgi:hypothetical protein